MRTDTLDGTKLDYWCARALCTDDDMPCFRSVEPLVVVTVASGAWRRLDAPFTPSASWHDAGPVFDCVEAVRATRHAGRVKCDVQFAGIANSHAGDGPNLRVAVLRAFVRARFGDDTGERPDFPHAVQRGQIVRYDPGTPVPEPASDAPALGNAADIHSVPRM